MLTGKLIHPEILEALAGGGHGSKVLIADGNYPVSTKRGANATVVYLNLMPGVVSAVQVLKAVVSAIRIERVEVMQPSPADKENLGIKGEPSIWKNFRETLLGTKISMGAGIPMGLAPLERSKFYEDATSSDVALIIATGEPALFANVLLTIGVVKPK